jgi:hypothetical protein
MLSFLFLYTALSRLNFKLQHVTDVPGFLNVIVSDRQVLVLLQWFSVLVLDGVLFQYRIVGY